MTEQLTVEDRNGVRIITWTRPDALNAMSIEMWDCTRDALDSAEADGVRSIVLTGTGRAFTVGQDLSEFGDPRHAAEDGGFRGLMRALSEVPLPLVAAVNGLGVGFGLTVLPWCDLVLIAPSAKRRYSSLATRAEAAPPNPFSSATICGIAVISTVRARNTPMPAPSTRPTRIQLKLTISQLSSVATTATSMPIAA